MGVSCLFPMYSALRRRERRQDIIEELRNHYRVTEVIDYSPFEDEGCCLEGTGSLVLRSSEQNCVRLALKSLQSGK